MSTGDRYISTMGMFDVPGIGAIQLGTQKRKIWSGGDSITAQTPRNSYPPVARVRKNRERRSRVALPPNNYSMQTEEFNTLLFLSDVGAGYDRWFSSDSAWGSGCENLSYDATNELKLIQKLREKVYGSGFSPAVFAAEGRQALGMIKNSAERIGSGLNRLRARDGHGVLEALGLEPNNRFSRGLKDRTRSLGSSWLEVQYGWMPLLKDAEQAAIYLADGVTDASKGESLVVRKVWSEFSTGSVMPYNSGFCRRCDIHELTIRLRAWSAASRFVPNIYSAAEVAWEKIPYSFIADWFVPIGSILNALKTRESLSGTFVRSLKSTSVGLDWRTGSGFLKPAYGFFPPEQPKKLWVNFQRTVTTELSVPNISAFISDDVATFKSWRHAANAVALLVQRDWSNPPRSKRPSAQRLST